MAKRYKISWASGCTTVPYYRQPAENDALKKGEYKKSDPHMEDMEYEALREYGQFVEIGKDIWVNKRFLKDVTTHRTGREIDEPKNESTNNETTNDDEGYDLEEEQYADYLDSDSDYIKNNSNYRNLLVLNMPENLQKLYGRDMAQYLNMFGAPFIFTEDTDPPYYKDVSTQAPNSIKVGHTMMETVFSAPSCFSIFPGKVRYLPGFNKSEKESFFREVQERLRHEGDSNYSVADGGKFSGQLYDLQCDYADYMNRYNTLARTSAIMLGLGDHNMPGTKMTLKNYDYSYYTTADRRTNWGDGKGGGKAASSFLWQLEKGLESSIIQKNQYIHFFVTGDGSISISDSHNTQLAASPLENIINSSQLNDAAKNLSYLFGGIMNGDGFIGKAAEDVNELIDRASASGSYTGSFAQMASNYLKGGRLVAPSMIDTVGYENSVSAKMTFRSITGNKLDIFLRTILPALAILNFVMPKQLTENMYTYPYIVRCYQPGCYNCDLAAITSMNLTRGGADDTCWTMDGLSTELTVEFEITPLYSSLMGGNGKNPFQFLTNTPLLEYLGNLCGLDLKINNLSLKAELFKTLWENKFQDIPTSAASKITNAIRNKIGDLFNF